MWRMQHVAPWSVRRLASTAGSKWVYPRAGPMHAAGIAESLLCQKNINDGLGEACIWSTSLPIMKDPCKSRSGMIISDLGATSGWNASIGFRKSSTPISVLEHSYCGPISNQVDGLDSPAHEMRAPMGSWVNLSAPSLRRQAW